MDLPTLELHFMQFFAQVSFDSMAAHLQCNGENGESGCISVQALSVCLVFLPKFSAIADRMPVTVEFLNI